METEGVNETPTLPTIPSHTSLPTLPLPSLLDYVSAINNSLHYLYVQCPLLSLLACGLDDTYVTYNANLTYITIAITNRGYFHYQQFPTLPLPPVPYGTIAIPFFLTVGNAGKCRGLWQMVT
ncbi:unnamed protein product, partial [Nesidiocoris tenuis]